MRNRKALRGVWVPLFILAILAGSLWNGGAREASAAGNLTEVSYPVQTFQDGKARFFEHQTGERITIKYFILKSPDGVIRAAFDACDVCWPEGKGYKQKGDFMICVNCGRRFATNRVGELRGGCNPAPLRRELMGDKVVIQVKDILEGKRYFNFPKKG
ncbi:MAG: DUF2318 domain-containing protein [Syntrophaceae bacterium]|nr:DUF2318 domain-containing protein [Syntrophaceae bacterium]